MPCISPESDMLSDPAELLGEHGVPTRRQNTDLIVASRISTGGEIAFGGGVESPDFSVRVPRASFAGPVPSFGQRIDGNGRKAHSPGNHPAPQNS